MAFDGFIRVASGMPELRVGDTAFNVNSIKNLYDQAVNDQVALIVFPELCVTGYTCGDLFFQEHLIETAKATLIELKHYTKGKLTAMVVGVPYKIDNALYNCGAFLLNGVIYGLVPKTFLPNYHEFYEHRWFSSAKNLLVETVTIDGQSVPVGTDILFAHEEIDIFKVGIEVCEDLWTPIPPSTHLALNGATVIANLSASDEVVGKVEYRRQLLASHSARMLSSYIYSSCGYGESTTDVVYSGHCAIYENGIPLIENERFLMNSHFITADVDLSLLSHDRMQMTTYRDQGISMTEKPYRRINFPMSLPQLTLRRYVDAHPFVPSNPEKRDERCKEIFAIQTSGLAKRLAHIGCGKVVLGVSGGLDSTLALLVCVKTLDLLGLNRKNILAVTMPGFGTTDRTYQNAVKLIEALGCTFREISIREASLLHFKDIEHDPNIHNVTYENVQARERTQILMDLATKENAFVVGTGDLSELALGWATYNGDHMSMYGVNASVPKTLVRHLVEWVALRTTDAAHTKEILLDVLDTPVSPELLPPDEFGQIRQKTEDTIGPYELHDFFLYHLIRHGYRPSKIYQIAQLAFKDVYTEEVIYRWLTSFYQRFFIQQYKRSCIPDGPKVGSVSLSPRGDWRMPSDAVFKSWLEEIKSLR